MFTIAVVLLPSATGLAQGSDTPVALPAVESSSQPTPEPSSQPSGSESFDGNPVWTIQYHSVPLDLLLYGMASTVSVTRVTAGQHFPSDAIVGSVFGYLTGNYVAHKPDGSFPTRGGKFAHARDALREHFAIGVQ